jgi:hypothetical protein
MLEVIFISLGKEDIYSSDPGAPHPTRGLGGERRLWQKAHSGNGLKEARK